MNPGAGFLHIFPESLPCAHVSGLSDRGLLERMHATDETCAVDVALCKKPYELPSLMTWRAKDPVICRLLSNFKSGLTVKISSRMTKKFLPSDLPSKQFAGGDRCR
jgi:hypothetical protein